MSVDGPGVRPVSRIPPAAPERDLGRSALPEVEAGAGFFGSVGAVAEFTWAGIREIPNARPFAAEIIRQAAIIATGSVLVIMAIAFLAGGSCGLESTALARSFGVDPVAGGFSTWCTLREVVPFVFGYILAAKVGCGIVAELGAMQVAEEVEALDVMAVPSIPYLVSTRMIAAAIVLPIAYALAIGASYLAAFLMSVYRFGDVSPGTWSLFFYNFQDPVDIAYSFAKGMTISAFVIAVALFFGYRVRGGPIEVGTATARSMAVNIIGVTMISMFGTLIFWGANPRIPVG